MKFSKLLILLLGVVLSISTAHCADQESNEDAYQYIKLFDGDFPIPLRFELISWSDESLEYSSSAPLRKLRRKDLWTETPQRGFITVEAREGLENETENTPVVTLIATCGWLEISRVTPQDMPNDIENQFPPIFRIADKKHYLIITDYEENLWRELAKVFAEGMQIRPSSCQI